MTSRPIHIEQNIEFGALMDNLGLGVARISSASRQPFLFVNNPFAHMLGYEVQDFFQMPARKVVADWPIWENLVKEILAKGMLTQQEISFKHRGGQMVLCLLSGMAVRTTAGIVEALDIIVQDISSQRRAEAELRESKELFQTVFQHSAIAIFVTDKDDRIIAWNPFAEKMLGMEKKELFNKPAKELHPTTEWKRIRSMRNRQKGALSDMETIMYKKDRGEIDVNLSVSLIKNQAGEVEGFVGIVSDITEKKRFQQELMKAKNAAEEANNAKSMFLANMSHEVRTPMNTIMGMIDLTLDTQLTEEQKDNLQTVKNAADILLTLLNDILDLTRVEAGKIQLERIELSIRDILRSVCKSLSVLAKNKGLKLVWDVAADVPELVMGDPTRIRQVMVNLINNAIKFTFKGSIQVSVKIKSRKGDECQVIFSVKDDGVGIPKDKQQTLFEVFSQADASTTRRFGGTGLGLAISRRLVEMMGGRIWLESEEFKGSTFYFQLPFAVVKKEDVPQALKVESIEDQLLAQLQPKTAKRDLTHLSILLAEDNIVNQKMTVRMLEKRGWKVTSADNGQQVLGYLEKGTFDLILMDAQMPVLDGFETTRLIREKEKTTGLHIPIVALTARAMSGDQEKCLEVGMDGFVPKPIDREKLYQSIEKFF